jgi:hypothetical protein
MQETSLAIHNKHVERDGVVACTFFGDVPINNLGSLCVEICIKCGLIVAYCNHTFNEWNADETVLSCRLCGLDGT